MTAIVPSQNEDPRTANDSEVLVKVEGVSKKFCRSLKKSLWYGIKDIAHELNPFSHRSTAGCPLPIDNCPSLRTDEFWAVNNVSFALKRGECLGLIGHNGAGKTTLLKMLNGLIKPDSGLIEMRGRVGALIALGAGFNPILTGRENIYVNASILGLTKREIDEKLDEIIDFAEIGEFIDMPVQNYSSGMQVRLGFAVATSLKPDILLLDEVLAVGDTPFRAKCFKRIGKILCDSAVIFVSHSESQVKRICNSTLLLMQGNVEFKGATEEGLIKYRRMAESKHNANIILGDGVSLQKTSKNKHHLNYGDDLELEIMLRLNCPQSIGVIICHFSNGSGDVAHSVVTQQDDNASHLSIGCFILKLTISNITLVNGIYSLSVSVFDRTNQLTIAQLLSYDQIEVHGELGFGPGVVFASTCNIVTKQ